MAMRFFCVAVGTITCVITLSVRSIATPDAAKWHRETVLGENATEFFVLRAEWWHGPWYYSYSERIELERINAEDLTVQETWLLKCGGGSQDLATNVWSYKSCDSADVDLGDVLHDVELHPVFSPEFLPEEFSKGLTPESFEIDSSGVWLWRSGRRALVVTQDELRRQIPDLHAKPVIVGRVRGTWKGPPPREYLSVRSGLGASSDVDWFEDVLVVPFEQIRKAKEAVGS